MINKNKFSDIFVREGNSIVFQGDYLDIYIPKDSFKHKLAEYNGNYINSIGILFFEIISDKEVDNESRERVFHRMLFPNTITFQYTDILDYTGSINGTPEIQYDVFRLEQGNQFIANVNFQKDSGEVIRFVNKLHNGNIPQIVPYEDILKLYLDVLAINNVSLKAPSLLYELVISEACRYKNDLSKPYRDAYNKSKKGISEYDYKNVRINKLPQLNSTFAGLTFENMTDSVISGLDRSINGGEEKESPIEKTIKY